jgi:5-methylthioadenosine/S-adenosylhomocysteine deaminase
VTRYVADAVVTCDEAMTVHRPGAVDVRDGRIAWVGDAGTAPRREDGDDDRRLDGLLMPGLVNVHCHSPMTLFRGASEDVDLAVFLRDILWPREAKLTYGDVYWGMSLACAELLSHGVTTTCEMYFVEEAMVDAVVHAGSRCVVTPGVIDAPGWEHLGSWQERLDSVLAFHDEHRRQHERVEIGIAAHGAYSLSLDALEALAGAARQRGALVHIHVAETRQEGRELEERHGKTVPAILDGIGFFDGRVLAAHCVWLTEDDRRLLAERDVAIAHCPTSNAKLASGVAPLADWLARGIRVGIGTDGPSSNNDLDLWEESRLAALVARIQTDRPDAISASETLALATRGGAAALGRDDIGVLEPGRWADMVLVRTADPAFVPVVEDRDLLSHLVWSAGSRLVTDVWVAGEQVVAEGRCLTVDGERARAEVQQRALRLARG